MTDSEMKNVSENNFKIFGENHIFLAAGSLCALFITFFVSNADFTFQSKTTIFLSIVIFYLAFCYYIYFRQKRRAKIKTSESISENTDTIFNAEIEAKLLALEEANQYFGASLKPSDMFRLVASRIGEMISFDAGALFFVNQEKTELKIAFAVGENAKKLIGTEINLRKGLAGKTFQRGTAQTDEKLFLDKTVLSEELLKDFSKAIAVPLFHSDEIFGVLELFGAGENKFNQNSLRLLEAIGTRVAPLFLSSRAFETNLANALTDALTNLPNERAFFLVLENQIAESQRYRDERPLTILTFDIKNFADLNNRFGHTAGDRILEFAAGLLKQELRQMDFLARSMSDEFLAVLPTASEKITLEIIERVEKAFVSKTLEITPQEKINLKLNFGAASFGADGETPEQLLKHAILRKQQSKSAETSKILWFPKEFVN